MLKYVASSICLVVSNIPEFLFEKPFERLAVGSGVFGLVVFFCILAGFVIGLSVLGIVFRMGDSAFTI